MLREAFGEHSLSRAADFQWHSRFKASWVSVEDDQRSWRPSTSKRTENVEKIRELIHKDSHQTIHELANTTGISYGVCQEILTENLIMHRIATKFVPRCLTNDQKQWSVNVCLELWEKANEDPAFISRNITGDGSWIYGYDREAKQQSLPWRTQQSPRTYGVAGS
jgi:hypothetical protein